MATQEGTGNRPPIDSRLLISDGIKRAVYGLEIFRGLIGSERFGQALTRLGFNPLQAPFVSDTAKLILPADKIGSIKGEGVIFRPDNNQENKEGGRHARVYSPRAGVVELTAHFPTEERVLAAGLVNWGIIRKEEAQALEPLVDRKRPFLRLVAMDPSIRKDSNLFVEATHSDEPDLKPKTGPNSLLSIFKRNPLYEVRIYTGETDVVRYEKGQVRTEEWITIPPLEGEGFLLVGKRANSKVA